MIEAASNDGYQLDVFRRSGARVLGIDPPRRPRWRTTRASKPAAPCSTGTRSTPLLAEGHRADILVGNNVLNLIPDPREFADDCARLLKPDGLLVLEVPYPTGRHDRHGGLPTTSTIRTSPTGQSPACSASLKTSAWNWST
ncbi:MAG: methyltransferase domain-containing protein [Planctomycetota bacterium]